MTESQAKGMMGLSVRAGQAVFGEELCLSAIRSGQAGLVVLDAGASDNARKRYTDACRSHSIPLCEVDAGCVEEATGKRGRIAMVVKGGFAEKLRTMLQGKIPEPTPYDNDNNGNNHGGASVE